MRLRTYLLACLLLAAPPAGALTSMLSHDVINGCFQLKPGPIELTSDGARGLDALIQLISGNRTRILDARVTVIRPWPSPGSQEKLFLSDANYQSFTTTKSGSDAHTEGRVYSASEASGLVAGLLPKAFTTLHEIAFSEMRSAELPRCGMEVTVQAALNDPPGPFYLFQCDAQGCRKLKEL
jgi:hypothetical protein